mmetsp:Transcript_10513/g.18578  ORF Transcript_10513/g.18578 Transcript_10513/m.18578 type:complete len:142 (-) Transcript_10513:64-489(-)
MVGEDEAPYRPSPPFSTSTPFAHMGHRHTHQLGPGRDFKRRSKKGVAPGPRQPLYPFSDITSSSGPSPSQNPHYPHYHDLNHSMYNVSCQVNPKLVLHRTLTEPYGTLTAPYQNQSRLLTRPSSLTALMPQCLLRPNSPQQ